MSRKVEKQLIFVVEPSRVLSKLICIQLKEEGYATETFSDGLKVLRRITEKTPDCIIADKVLPVVDGLELCTILKEGSSKNGIPFILVSAEDEVLDFWTNATGANKVVSISHANFDSLIEETKKVLNFKHIEADSFFDAENEIIEGEQLTSDEKMLLWSVHAMDKSEFFFNMMKKVMSLYSYVQKIDTLITKLFEMFYELCDYDVCAIILNGNTTIVYKTGTEHLEGGTTGTLSEEFWEICKAEYEQNITEKQSITYESKLITDVVPKGETSGDFSSYRSFDIKAGKTFVGTIHFASYKKKLFNYKVQSSIDFLLPSLAYLLQESLHHETISLAEFKLRSAFTKFVPAEVIKDILSSKKSEEKQNQINNNEKRKIVILMCDIRSFTSISEINQPEDVVGFLNAYFTQMVNIVTKYGGTVDKFIGDAIMVLFGAPVSYNDNAQRAVNAAIEMYERLPEVPLGQLKFPEGIKLDIGIGLHYGDVIVGNIGSQDKTNYTVIGDAVNLASRLEGLTKLYGAKVIISEAVQEEVSAETNVMLLDAVKVKGKTQGVKIYRADSKPLPAEFSESYEKGFKSYSEGAFNLAIPYFKKALEIIPEDKAAKLMLERSNEFAVNKPENWDGAVALTSK